MPTEEIVKMLVRRQMRIFRSLVSTIIKSRSLGWRRASATIAAALLAAQSSLPTAVIVGMAAGVTAARLRVGKIRKSPSRPPVKMGLITLPALKSILAKGAVSHSEFVAMDAHAKKKAFAVYGLKKSDTAAILRSIQAMYQDGEVGLQAMRSRAAKAVSRLSPSHSELVYRMAVNSAYADGNDSAMSGHEDVFPYVAYHAIHDDRARPNHIALESLGLNGTNIYRADDPVIRTFRPPWDYNCRCGRSFLTISEAAAAGVAEAKRWRETGVPPKKPARVRWPKFRPPPGFVNDSLLPNPPRRRSGTVR
jgi:SPP1 gp7 family putative phage head morphogenesis protein